MYQRIDNAHAAHRTVLVVGLGALGCPAADLLARGGVGHLKLLDPDDVELSNLQRQVLFERRHIGRSKVSAAREALKAHHPRIEIEAIRARLDASNVADLMASCDFVVDACDDARTKLLINSAASAAGVPFVYGGVARTGGQTMGVAPGVSACIECVFPNLAADIDADEARACSELGILAPVAGVIGALEGMAALGALCQDARYRPGIMTTYQLRGRRWRQTEFLRKAGCRACGTGATVAPRTTGRPHPCPS